MSLSTKQEITQHAVIPGTPPHRFLNAGDYHVVGLIEANGPRPVAQDGSTLYANLIKIERTPGGGIAYELVISELPPPVWLGPERRVVEGALPGGFERRATKLAATKAIVDSETAAEAAAKERAAAKEARVKADADARQADLEAKYGKPAVPVAAPPSKPPKTPPPSPTPAPPKPSEPAVV